MEELFKNISEKDLDKLKFLFSILPHSEQKEVVTLRVFMEEYSNLIKKNRSKAYYISVMSSFKHLNEYFGERKAIQEIGLKEIENFSSYLQQKVNKGFYVYYRTLKAAFNKAKEWGYVSENYLTKVKLPKRQKLAPAFVNSDQLSAISNQIKNEVVKDVVVFAFYTGMRLDEIVNLRWKNVDLQNRVITVGDDKFITKGRTQRFIPISDEALTSVLSKLEYKRTPSRLTDGQAFILPLGKRENISGFVFCKEDGEKFTGNYISRRFKKACKAAGMDNAIHFHSLRHSFASNLVQRGVPLYTIKELLGHSSVSTTEIYSHLNMETLREAIKKLDEPPLSFGRLPLGKGEKPNVKIFRINGGEKQ